MWLQRVFQYKMILKRQAFRQRAAEFIQTTHRRSRSGSGAGRIRRGYLRVDTVHQGDWEGEKGVDRVNPRMP